MLYERIKELCRQNGTTISALERECGLAKGSVSKIDRHKPNAEKLQKIANYLEVSVEELMGTESPVQTDVQKEYYFSSETKAIAEEIFTTPGMRILFDAARDSRPEDLQMAADLLKRLKATNPND